MVIDRLSSHLTYMLKGRNHVNLGTCTYVDLDAHDPKILRNPFNCFLRNAVRKCSPQIRGKQLLLVVKSSHPLSCRRRYVMVTVFFCLMIDARHRKKL